MRLTEVGRAVGGGGADICERGRGKEKEGEEARDKDRLVHHACGGSLSRARKRGINHCSVDPGEPKRARTTKIVVKAALQLGLNQKKRLPDGLSGKGRCS